MKKLLVLVVLVMLTFSFTACKATKKVQPSGTHSTTVDTGNATVSIGDIYTDFSGVNIKIKRAILGENESTLIAEWVNKTAYEVIYGESYAIERYENGEWVSCQKTSGEPTFHAIGICLNPTSTMEKTYSFFDIFDVSKAGKYRIITDCHVYNNGRESKAQKCNLLAEFTVNHSEGNGEPQSETSTAIGYCGNTQTTVYIGGDKYTFMGGNSVTLTDLLLNLNYGDEVCNCAPEYKVDTEFGTDYGINLTDYYVKYDGRQAPLTKTQAHTIKEIIDWVKTQEPDGKEE